MLGVLIAVLGATMMARGGFDAGALLASNPRLDSPGWILLIVALLGEQ